MRSAGGIGVVENCLHLCAPCHGWAHANPKVSYGHGVLLRRGDGEHPEPAMHYGWRTCDVDHFTEGVSTPGGEACDTAADLDLDP